MKTIPIFLFVILLPSLSFAQTSLNKAYQREVGYLKSQQHTLQKRVKVVEEAAQKSKNKVQGQVKGLQRKWLFLQAESERLQNNLSDANVKGTSPEDQNAALTGTYEQGRQSLLALGLKLPEKEVISAADFQVLYNFGIEGIRDGRNVTTKVQTYFDENGLSKKGPLTKIGRIAAYAEGIPLAPVGEGRFKLWPQRGNELPGVVLFESVEKAMTPPEEKTILDTIKAGGTIAYIIVALGILALLLLLVRAGLLIHLASPKNFATKLKEGLSSLGNVKELSKNSKGVVAKSVSELLEREKRNVEDIDEIVGGLAPKVERFSTIIMVIAAIAPLLGLLGTVTGMIATFDIITEFGTGDPKLLSSGISEALITTKFGLMVAIPTLVFGNIFRAWGGKIIDEMDHACLIVLGMDNAVIETVTNEHALAVVRVYPPMQPPVAAMMEEMV